MSLPLIAFILPKLKKKHTFPKKNVQNAWIFPKKNVSFRQLFPKKSVISARRIRKEDTKNTSPNLARTILFLILSTIAFCISLFALILVGIIANISDRKDTPFYLNIQTMNHKNFKSMIFYLRNEMCHLSVPTSSCRY